MFTAKEAQRLVEQARKNKIKQQLKIIESGIRMSCSEGKEHFIVEKEGGLNPEVVKVLEAKGFIVEKPFTYYRTSILWGDKVKKVQV